VALHPDYFEAMHPFCPPGSSKKLVEELLGEWNHVRRSCPDHSAFYIRESLGKRDSQRARTHDFMEDW